MVAKKSSQLIRRKNFICDDISGRNCICDDSRCKSIAAKMVFEFKFLFIKIFIQVVSKLFKKKLLYSNN